MPRNVEGKPIDPTPFNRNDGFSPGSLIITRVPGLDTPAAFARNGFPTNTDPSLSFAKEARAIHDGKSEDRGIYGQATPAEVRGLVEDGIPVAPLPPDYRTPEREEPIDG